MEVREPQVDEVNRDAPPLHVSCLGLLKKLLYVEASPRSLTLYTFIYHFSRKRYPFRIPSIDKWYPFHIPCLKICDPFNCRKCTVV